MAGFDFDFVLVCPYIHANNSKSYLGNLRLPYYLKLSKFQTFYMIICSSVNIPLMDIPVVNWKLTIQVIPLKVCKKIQKSRESIYQPPCPPTSEQYHNVLAYNGDWEIGYCHNLLDASF